MSFGEGGPNTWNVSESEEEINDIEITAEIKKKETMDEIGILYNLFLLYYIQFFNK